MPQNEAVINGITTIKCNWEHHINHSFGAAQAQSFPAALPMVSMMHQSQRKDLKFTGSSKKLLNFLCLWPIDGESV